jgi:hypothetical protein
MSSPRPEHTLLVLTLPTGRASDAAAFAELARSGLEWDIVLEDGHRLGALPLLGAALEASAVTVPPKVTRTCREALVHGALRAVVAARLLGEIEAALRGRGIAPIVLKGLPLAHELYDEPGLRPVGDVDLLVPRARRDEAIEALLGAGFVLPTGSLSVDFFRRHHFHLTFVRPGREGLPVELHWALQPRFSLSRIPEADIEARRRSLAIGGMTAWIPGREETFLYLGQHLVRHLLVFGEETAADPVAALLEPARRGRLCWLADLVLLARRSPGLDWALVDRLSVRWGLQRDLAGLRRFLACRGLAPVSSVQAVPGEGRLRMVRRVEEALPSAARAAAALQFRPILALELARAAWPGSDWIRWRHGTPECGASFVVAVRSVLHACDTVGAALRMGFAAAVGRMRAAGGRHYVHETRATAVPRTPS